MLQAASTFASSTLSSLYFDVVKDTLYCDAPSSPQRQAIIATMQHVSPPPAFLSAPEPVVALLGHEKSRKSAWALFGRLSLLGMSLTPLGQLLRMPCLIS